MTLDMTDLDLVTKSLFDDESIEGYIALASAPSSVWIASGLAKISASYGASMMQKIGGYPSRLMSSLDYCQTSRLRCLPLLVTLKGSNSDALAVAQAITNRNAPNALVLTGDREGQASRHLMNSNTKVALIAATLPDKDKRFVNCKSIFMLSALTHRVVSLALKTDEGCLIKQNFLTKAFYIVRQKAKNMVGQLTAVERWQERQIIILADGLVGELAITWQSILAESGIATSVCMDIKDYTHGDHLAATRTGTSIFLIIRHESIRSICDIFTKRFKLLYPVFTVDLEYDGTLRYWENLFFACNSVSLLTSALGYPGSRPPKNPVVWAWRGWGEVLCSNSLTKNAINNEII